MKPNIFINKTSFIYIHLLVDWPTHYVQVYPYFQKHTTMYLKEAQAARVAQWLESAAQGSDDPWVGIRTPLWDVGAGLSDETV